MANFLLVHGAWHGAWCWRDVLPALVRAGHRAHLLHAGTALQTHVTDVRQAIETEELHDVVLVGHSYAGMLVTAIANQMPGRLAHLVHLDAVVPKPGESWSSTHGPATRKARLDAARASPLIGFPPPDPAVFGLGGDDHAWVLRRPTPHPGHTCEEAVDVDILAACV